MIESFKRMFKKIEVMEAFANSSDKCVSDKANDFLNKFIWRNYLNRAQDIFLNHYDGLNHDEGNNGKLLPLVHKIVPLFALLSNMMHRSAEGFISSGESLNGWGGKRGSDLLLATRLIGSMVSDYLSYRTCS